MAVLGAHALRRAGRVPVVTARLARGGRQRWRRSLQTRVVVTTLVASGLVVLLLASLLLDQVGRGLVDAKTRASLSEAQAGLLQAQSQVEATLESPGGTERSVVETTLQRVAQELSDRGATGDLYDIVLVGPDTAKTFASPGASPADVPRLLRDRLRAEPTAYVFTDVPGPHGSSPGLVVGAVLTTSSSLPPYTLYHLFPLTSEEQTLSLVRRTAEVAGLLLVLLLALIAALVARQVVLPVRLAARTAERLAAGRLEERMRVRGEDEIAKLGEAFNTMAEALQRQIRQLEDLSHAQRRFVSDVSHELRTPLTTVRMAADVLHDARRDFPPLVARSTELLRHELDRFEELLVELLEISRYDAGAASLDAEPTDLVGVVRRAVARVEALAAATGSVVDVSGVPAGIVVVELDHVRVERVLRNLLVNAIEHGEGRPVEVSLASSRDAAAVVVRDHGLGLREGDVAHVFARFWRGDPSRARTTGGTGLGLAISLEDVRLHGGWLQAWGAPGRGAVFRMTLPRRPGGVLAASPLALVPGDQVMADPLAQVTR